MNWRDFEDACYNYLNKNHKFLNHDLTLVQKGKSNSNEPDISAYDICCDTNFYIECKMPTSQSSQFVIEINNDKYIYSKTNKSKISSFSKKIINTLNNNLNIYSKITSRGLVIDLSEDDIYDFIKSDLENKNIKYIITGNHSKKLIFPSSEIKDYLKIKAFIRRKKSGTSNLSKADIEIFDKMLGDFGKINIIKDNCKNKTYLTPSQYYFIKDKIDDKYFFRYYEKIKYYRVTKKSNSNNITIIFSLSLDKDKLNYL